MATGPEHYQEAERLIDLVDDGAEDWQPLAAEAQVHATLALAAATATNVVLQLPISSGLSKPWAKALGLAEHEAGEA